MVSYAVWLVVGFFVGKGVSRPFGKFKARLIFVLD
jgi:hypothetical protein